MKSNLRIQYSGRIDAFGLNGSLQNGSFTNIFQGYFPTWRAKMKERYNEFTHEVSHSFRYSLSTKSRSFLEDLITLADTNIKIVPKNKKLYRARTNPVNTDTNEISSTPYKARDMKPIPNRVSEGRVNPSNICVLYLADTIGTALSEVRAGTNHPVTIGNFLTNRELKIVDLTSRMNWYEYFFRPIIKRDIWYELSHDFSKPLSPHNHNIHYAKTQIIAETFKRHGFDGVCYRSQFIVHENSGDTPPVEGLNYALFDLESARCGKRKVYQATEQRMVFVEMKG